jgi:hypothetical protein
MTPFVQIDYSTSHAGVARAERGFEALRDIARSTRTITVLGAAIVAALIVVANEVVTTWTDGHLLAAWIVMWAMLFGVIALFVAPARRRTSALGAALGRWQASRRQAAEDRQVWNLAMKDARVMADIQRAMVAQSELRNPR